MNVGRNGAVYKLVVVHVGINQPPVEKDLGELDIFLQMQAANKEFGYCRIEDFGQFFLVFEHNVGGNAQNIITSLKLVHDKSEF